jgi:hypothetical protein
MSQHASDPEEFTNEPVYTPAGNWRPVIGNLARWLRLNNCGEYASELEMQAQSATPCSPPEVEINAVNSITSVLVNLVNNPPGYLPPVKCKELRNLRHQAIRSVGFRERQLADELSRTSRAVQAVKDFFDSQPKPESNDKPRDGQAREAASESSGLVSVNATWPVSRPRRWGKKSIGASNS